MDIVLPGERFLALARPLTWVHLRGQYFGAVVSQRAENGSSLRSLAILTPTEWPCRPQCWGEAREGWWHWGEEEDQQPFSFLSHYPQTPLYFSFAPGWVSAGAELPLPRTEAGCQERGVPHSPQLANCSVWKVSRVNTTTKGCGTCFSLSVGMLFSLYGYFKWFYAAWAIKTRDKNCKMSFQ